MLGVEALWSIEFLANTQVIGAGVLVCETLRAFGGDSNFMYVGKYKVENGLMRVEVRVSRHSHIGNMQTVFAPLDKFDLELIGRYDNDQAITLQGSVVGHPDLRIVVKMTRREELP